MKEKRDDVNAAKKALSQMDSELAIMAIRQLEIEQGTQVKELNNIKEKLGVFNIGALRTAAKELNLYAQVTKCIEIIKCSGNCVQLMVALDRVSQLINPPITDIMKQEIDNIKETLKVYDPQAIRTAIEEMNIGAYYGLCIDNIRCTGNCIQVMIVLDKLEMLVNPVRTAQSLNLTLIETVADRAVAKAIAKAKELGEI